MIPSAGNIGTITRYNQGLVDEVYAGIIANPEKGEPNMERPRFKVVPKFTEIVAKRNHDVLCFPTIDNEVSR